MSELTADEIVDLCLRHTLYDWQQQGSTRPIAVASARGCEFFTVDGKRYLDFNSQLMGVNIGHADPRVADAIAEQARVLPYISPFMATEVRAKLGAQARRAPAGRSRQGLLHARRRRGERERDPDREGGDRPAEDPRAVPLLPRRDVRDDHAHRRPPTVGERARDAGRRARARPVPRDAARDRRRADRARVPRGDDHARGPRDDRRVHPGARHGHERHPDPARRLPAGRPRALRPARDPADRRRGDVGVRAHRRVVRRQPLGRGAGHHHDGQGPDVVGRAARRGRPVAEGLPLLRRARVLRRPHLQLAPARARRRARDDPRVRGGRPDRAQPRRWARSWRATTRSWPTSIRRSGWSATSACSASSSSSGTARRWSRWRRSTARATR